MKYPSNGNKRRIILLTIAAEQQGRCAICADNLTLQANLDHETNEVRGVLCTGCNLGLGFFKDSVDQLGKAILYLREWGG